MNVIKFKGAHQKEKHDFLPLGQGGGCDVKLLIDGKEKTLPTKTDKGIRRPFISTAQ